MHTLQVGQTAYEIKIAGQALIVDFAKMHPTWIEAHLRKAAQRFLNDTYSSLEPSAKLESVIADLKMIHSGEEMPEKQRRAHGAGIKSDPITDLAVRNAKLDLVAAFKARTKLVKIPDMIRENTLVAAYFTDKAIWKDEVVMRWIQKQLEIGKRDYMADAKAVMEAGDEEELF